MADVKKLSFAKVAASASKDSAPIVPIPKVHAAVPRIRSEQAHVMSRDKATPGPRSTAVEGGEVHRPVKPVATGPAVVVASDDDMTHMVNGLAGVKLETSMNTTATKAVNSPLGDKSNKGSNVQKESADKDAAQTVGGLSGLKLVSNMPSVIVNGAHSPMADKSGKGSNSQTPSDEASQKADSNSDVGTKPPSLDGKSITSGTTFNALDEKESLRPDDSASMKAAAEDDDAFSIRGSYFTSSRMGSEVAVRVHRIQLGDMPPRTITQIVPESQLQGVITPQSGLSGQQVPPADRTPLSSAAAVTPDASNGFYSQNPDEKLLEAMQSSKDRLFLLRLEKDVIEFVQDSKEPFMDLPPCNSFCRMLTHKLADYYHMTHSFEAGAVRIFRTPFCRIPPPLASIATPSTSHNNTPPPAVLPRKIMRRGEDGEFGPGSSGPSKPTSEVGSDGKDKNSKEKLSREEREEAYKMARERIFGAASQTDASTPDNEDSNGVSRASSVSAKDRVAPVKKGRKVRVRDENEAFEGRSSYTPYYGHLQQGPWMAPQYVPVNNNQFQNGMTQQQQPLQPPYAAPVQPAMYGAPLNQPYQPMMQGNGYAHPVNNSMPTFQPPPHPLQQPMQQQPMQPQYQPPPTNGPPMPSYGPQAPPVPPQQNWQPAFNQSPYPARATPVQQPGIPYAFGQLPVNVNPNDPKSQHPIPGSFQGNYNRHAFNPKTQSFIPGNGMPPMPPMQPPTAPYLGGNGQQQIVPPPMPQGPPMPFNGGYQQQPMHQQPGYQGVSNGYGPMRQNQGNSFRPPPMTQHAPMQPAFSGPPTHPNAVHSLPSSLPSNIPKKPAVPTGPKAAQSYGNLPNYGNPATLPQKPPPT